MASNKLEGELESLEYLVNFELGELGERVRA